MMRGISEPDLNHEVPRSPAYPLATFTVDPAALHTGELSVKEAATYLDWLKESEPERVILALGEFERSGFSMGSRQDILVDILPFLVDWYPKMMAPYLGSHWIRGSNLFSDHPAYWPMRGPTPIVEVARFESSVAHDLTFLIASEIRKIRPDLEWSITTSRGRGRTIRHASFWQESTNPVALCEALLLHILQMQLSFPPDQRLERMSELMVGGRERLRDEVILAIEMAPRGN